MEHLKDAKIQVLSKLIRLKRNYWAYTYHKCLIAKARGYCLNEYFCVTLFIPGHFRSYLPPRIYPLLLLARSTICVNRCTGPGALQHRAHSCGTIGRRVLTKGVKARTGLLDFYTCTHVVCARGGRHAFESVCIYTHTCIRRSRSRYLRRAGPRLRSIMYQPQMCISPAGCRTMIDQCDTRGLMGRTVTRVHTGGPPPPPPRYLSARIFPSAARSSCYREIRINTYTVSRTMMRDLKQGSC